MSDDPVLDYALRELDWYANTRNGARWWHHVIELGSLTTAAATVVSAGLQAPPAVTASIAGLIVFIGGVRQAFDHAERYVLASEAWSRLNPAVERYRLLPEAERNVEARERLLQRVEAVGESEIQNWGASRRRTQSIARPGEHPDPNTDGPSPSTTTTS